MTKPSEAELVELKPCPFCGDEAAYEQVGSFAVREGCAWSVGCENELCLGFQSVTTYARKAEAAAAWNTRTSPELEQAREALKAVTSDRDEWKQQHENLLSVRETDLRNLTAGGTANG